MYLSSYTLRLKSSFLLVATILFWLLLAQLAHAAEVTFSDITVTATGKNLVVSFTQLGIAENLKYGISIQDENGNRVLEETAIPDVGTNRQLQLSISKPMMTGAYEMYLFARTADNRIATVAYAGEIDLTTLNASTDISQAKLLSCAQADVTTTFTCEVSQAAIGLTLRYDIHPNTLYTPAIAGDTVTIAGEKETINISSSLNPGPYEAVFVLTDQSGQQIDSQKRLKFTIDGPWGTIDARLVSFVGQQFSADVWFDGPQVLEGRLLQYWVVGDKGTVCDTALFELSTLNTRHQEISGTLPNDCTNPQLVAALYTGSVEDGSLTLLAQTGTDDIETLLRQTPGEQPVEMGINSEKTLSQLITLETLKIAQIVVAVVLCALILLLLFIVFRKKLFPPTAILLLLLLGATSVQAATFSGTRDNDSLTVSIPDNLKAGETGNVVVTLEDILNPGTKPSGASVAFSIDGGAYQEVMSQTFASPYKNVTIGPFTAGAHSMNVRLPGNFFGSAFFGFARFGIVTKDFLSSANAALRFTVDLPGNSPYSPVIQKISGPEIGRPNEIYNFSFQAADDPDGDEIKYEVDWTGGDIQWLPSATTYTTALNNRETAEHSWSSVGTTTFRARTHDDVGRVSDWALYSIVNNYQGPTLETSKPYVREDEELDLTWDTTDSAPSTCTITGPDMPSGPLTATTSTAHPTIGGVATFTINCEHGSASVTVKLLPKVQET